MISRLLRCARSAEDGPSVRLHRPHTAVEISSALLRVGCEAQNGTQKTVAELCDPFLEGIGPAVGKATPDRYGMLSPATADARRILTCVGLTWNEAPFKMPPKRTYKPRRAKP